MGTISPYFRGPGISDSRLPDRTVRKSYRAAVNLPTFKERYEYLRVPGRVGMDTFGADRYLNQILYNSPEWRRFRRDIIIRDNGCDLAHPDRPIKYEKVIIHHLNPLTVEDIENRSPVIFDPDNVICVTHMTHQAIHYGDENHLAQDPIARRPNDTCPWK